MTWSPDHSFAVRDATPPAEDDGIEAAAPTPESTTATEAAVEHAQQSDVAGTAASEETHGRA
jgi:hypothetical protein